MENKRQKQSAEIIRRNFGQVLQAEGPYIYGTAVFVTVTKVAITPDFSIAKIYLSIYNTDAKQKVVDVMNLNKHKLKQELVVRIRKHIRRIPDIAFYLDETLDEVFKIGALFDRLHQEDQMGEEE